MHEVEGGGCGCWCARFDLFDSSQNRLLLGANLAGFGVVKAGADPAVEPVVVEDFNPRFQSLELRPLLPDRSFPRGPFGQVRFDVSHLEPFGHFARYYKLLDVASELLHEVFLARVRFLAFSAVPGAMVVHITALLYLRDEHARTVTAAHEPAECEIALNSVTVGVAVAVEKFLNAVPRFLRDQRFVCASVELTVEIEITAVKPLAENLVQSTFVNPGSSKRQPLGARFRYEFLERESAGREKLEKLPYHRRAFWVGHDHAFAVWSNRVFVADWSARGVHSTARFFGHALDGFFAKVLAVVARDKHLDAVNELLA